MGTYSVAQVGPCLESMPEMPLEPQLLNQPFLTTVCAYLAPPSRTARVGTRQSPSRHLENIVVRSRLPESGKIRYKIYRLLPLMPAAAFSGEMDIFLRKPKYLK